MLLCSVYNTSLLEVYDNEANHCVGKAMPGMV